MIIESSNHKIVVTPEGREGCWLADRASLKIWIESRGFDGIHNFSALSSMVLGADHSVDGVLADINAADRVAILTGTAQRGNLGHALALVMPQGHHGLPERLEMYDLGVVTEDDLQVVAQ